MKKRIFVLWLAAVFTAMFALAGCGESGGQGSSESGGGENTEHEHMWTAWTPASDGETHSRQTTCEGHAPVVQSEQHDFQNGVCATCGAEEPGDGGGGGEPVERKLRNLPADFKYDVDKMEYKIKGDGIEIYGERFFPIEAGKYPVVIMCHGFNGHYTDFPTECNRLAQRGYNVYAFDFVGAQANGKSTGRTENDYTPLTMKEDLITVIEHFKQAKFVDNTQIFLWGGSQGGFVAGLAAADDRVKDDVSALALYFPAFNIPDDWHGKPEQKTPLMGYYINADFIHSVQELDPYAVIPAYKGDVCIVWGTEDALVKRTYIDRAVEAYGAERAALTVLTGDGAGHGFGGAALTKAVDTVLAFLEAHTYEPL